MFEKLESLPYKSYEELAGTPPSLHATFYVSYSLLQLRKYQEAFPLFDRLLAHSHVLSTDGLLHTLLNYGSALSEAHLWTQAIEQFNKALKLAEQEAIPKEHVYEATRLLLEALLNLAREELHQLRNDKQQVIQELESTLHNVKARLADETTKLGHLQQNLQTEHSNRLRLDAELQDQQVRLLKLEKEKSHLQQNLQTEHSNRLRLDAELQDQIHVKEKQGKTIERLTSQRHALIKSLNAARDEVNVIRGSRSWKLVERYWLWKDRKSVV